MSVEDWIQFVVPEGIDQVRADKVISHNFPNFSRTQIQKVFKTEDVYIDEKAISRKYLVSSGETINFKPPEQKTTSIKPVSIPLDIIFEDEHIIVLNKDSGIVVHPGANTAEDTLVHALLHYTGGELSTQAGELRPGVVHRLDKETSGLILFAKNDKAFLSLTQQFTARTVDKEYLALIHGVPELDGGSIKNPIGRHPVNRVKMAVVPEGKVAHTDWQIEERLRFSALVRCWLHTGRTHQIRVHLSYMGHPIMGDRRYGYFPKPTDTVVPDRVLLHAEKIAFIHSETEERMQFEQPVPEGYSEYLKLLRK